MSELPILQEISTARGKTVAQLVAELAENEQRQIQMLRTLARKRQEDAMSQQDACVAG